MEMLSYRMQPVLSFLVFVPVFIIIFSLSSCIKEVEKIMKVRNDSISDVSNTSAKALATIIDLGSGIDQHGHCWSTSADLTVEINDDKSENGPVKGTGSFTSIITGLLPDTKYYVRAYVKKSSTVVYGDDILSFRTLKIDLPVVSTDTIYDISESGAIAAGNLISMGTGVLSVSEHGHCWSNETTTPTIDGSKTSLGIKNQTGSFESVIVGLLPGTLYYIRAYATNDAGTAYGDTASFSTRQIAGLPELTTADVTEITGTTATSGGSIVSDGGSPITAKGVCWSGGHNPTVSDNHTNEGSGTASFVSYLAGLNQKTLYHVRAYATNANGTGYGGEIAFVTGFNCGSVFTDPRDGKTYLTVQIGDQCWMAENLNVGTRINGKQNPEENGVIEKYCYEDNEDNCDIYGGLYQWDEMMQYTTIEMTQGVCPKGWHIPSDNEWKILEMELGMSQETADSTSWRGTGEGGKLKAPGITYWDPPNRGATNSSHFTALPAGHRDTAGNFSGLGYNTSYWTSTLISDTQAWRRYLSADEYRIYRGDGNRIYGASVRCIED